MATAGLEEAAVGGDAAASGSMRHRRGRREGRRRPRCGRRRRGDRDLRRGAGARRGAARPRGEAWWRHDRRWGARPHGWLRRGRALWCGWPRHPSRLIEPAPRRERCAPPSDDRRRAICGAAASRSSASVGARRAHRRARGGGAARQLAGDLLLDGRGSIEPACLASRVRTVSLTARSRASASEMRWAAAMRATRSAVISIEPTRATTPGGRALAAGGALRSTRSTRSRGRRSRGCPLAPPLRLCARPPS